MSFSKKKTDQNQNTHHKRTIKDHNQCPHCHGIRNATCVHAILPPQFTDSSSDSACLCNYKSHVVKSKPRVKWAPNNSDNPIAYKTTTSKYHTKCIAPPPKPKLRIVIPRKQIDSNPLYTEVSEGGVHVYKNQSNCRNKKIRPLLPCKSYGKQTACIKNDTGRCTLPKHKATVSHSLPTLKKAKDLLDYTPESEFLKRLRKQAKETFDCQCAECKLEDEMPKLKFTAGRQLLEEHYDDAKKYNINEICRDQHSCLKDTNEEVCMYKNVPPYSMHERPRSKDNATDWATDCATIHSIRHIRDENYFDTHSTAYLDRKRIPEHICEHKFTLNERLLPLALNTDAYGVSRCTICNKPMENTFVEYKNRPFASGLQKSGEKFYTGDVSCHFPTVSSYSGEQLTPNPEYVSKAVQTTFKYFVKNHIIYLYIPMIADPRIAKMKRPYVPENSWALRYQKMC